jgi:hypothetical protein
MPKYTVLTKFLLAVLGVAIALSATPVVGADHDHGLTIWDILLAMSGGLNAMDHNPYDYDISSKFAVLSSLDQKLSDKKEDLTLFAGNDDRLTVLIVVTQQWRHATTAVAASTRGVDDDSSMTEQLQPSLAALTNLQKVLHHLTLVLQRASTDRSVWTKWVVNLAVATSTLEALHEAETNLNAALPDFQAMQNHQILQM